MRSVAKEQWFMDTLRKEENAGKVGFDGKNWRPHPSTEGGAPTIGYGHKITTPIVTIQGKQWDLLNDQIPDSVIEALYIQDVALAEKKAAQEFTKHSPHGKGEYWSQLPTTYKAIYTELVYNIGTLQNKKGKWGWPKLSKGIKNDDPKAILGQLSRKAFNAKTGKDEPLTKRTTAFKRAYKKLLGKKKGDKPTAALDRFNTLFPNSSDMNPQMRMNMLVKIHEDEEKASKEQEVSQSNFNLLIDEANERDREIHTIGEETPESREEQVASVEETAATKDTPLEEVHSKQKVEPQFFMKPDGSVIKVDGEGKALA